jgi:hypothetical protein
LVGRWCKGVTMSHDSHNGLESGTPHRRRSREAMLSRPIILISAALCLCGSAGCTRSPTGPAPAAGPTPGEVLFAKMRAAIESVSRGIVDVETQTPSNDGRSQVKRTLRLVFDDGGKMLRCDRDRPSGSKGLRCQSKYASTPKGSLFQYIDEPYYGGIMVCGLDRPPYLLDDQPLDPHVLWFAHLSAFHSGGRYSDILRRWIRAAKEAGVSQDQAGRFVLSLTLRETPQRLVQRLVIDPKLGFVPIRNEVAFGFDKPVITTWTNIRYEKQNGHFVPVSLELHDGGVTINATCRWESVNENIDPKVFTVEGFEPRDGTAINDWNGQRPVLRGFTSRKDVFQKSIAQAMDANKALDVRLANSLADSRLFENYVLVFAASPKSEVTRRFFSILKWREPQEGDEEARNALGNFARLPIDASAPERAAELKTLLARWKLASPSPDDALFAIVDHNGHLVAATTAKQLGPDKMDARRLTAFLNEHRAPVPDAQTRLADALAQAKRENKRVLIEQSGAWCGWCHILARYLETHRSLIEKDYVWIMLDRRFAHGQEVIEKLRPKAEGGVPWMVILDSDGKPLITSDGPRGNLGYPGDVKDRPHFAKMLHSTAQHLSDAEINILLADVLRK